MADFPPNLDDGEIYLPSGILPNEMISAVQNPSGKRSSSRNSPEFPCELTYMEDLAQQLAAYALLERNLHQRAPKPRPNSAQNSFAVHSPQSGFVHGNHPATPGYHDAGYGNACFRFGSRPGVPLIPVRPRPAQKLHMEGFVHARARALQRQQQNPVQNRLLPFRLSNGSGTTGFLRDSGGTGVFLPRVVSSEFRKKPCVKSAEQKLPMKNVGKQRLAFQHPSSDNGLPQDWTY